MERNPELASSEKYIENETWEIPDIVQEPSQPVVQESDVEKQAIEVSQQITEALRTQETGGGTIEILGDKNEHPYAEREAHDETTTFLDRHPTLAKWARNLMFVAGASAAMPVFGADKISVEQQVGGGTAVAELTGNEYVTTESFGGKKNSTVTGKKQTPRYAAPAATQHVETTVTINGKKISNSHATTGAVIVDNGESVVVGGKKIPLKNGSRIEVTQKADEVTGSVVGVQGK